MFQTLKSVAKASIRTAVRARLAALPLSLETAEWYSQQIRRWPSVLGNLNYSRLQKLPAGFSMHLGIVDVIERSLLTSGRWDPIVECALKSRLKPGDTFLDVGANIGYFTLTASQIVGPEGRVVSFEPSARALSRLTTHLCLNKCTNVTVCSCAAGESAGTARLNWAPASNIGGSTIARGTASQGYTENIAVRTIDSVCRELQLAPSVIKIDVEGFELFALRGAEQTLRTHHPVVICELTDAFLKDHGHSSAQMLQYMQGLGYTAWLIDLDSDGKLATTPCQPGNMPGNQAEIMFSVAESPDNHCVLSTAQSDQKQTAET